MAAAAPAAELPFELANNVPWVEVRVDGRGPYTFLVDSGSSYTVLDSRRAADARIAVTPWEEQRGAGDATLASDTAGGATVAIGDAAYDVARVVVAPIDAAISAAVGRRVDGLLGYDFFAGFAVELCYGGLELRLRAPGDGSATEADLPLAVVREHPFVDGALVLRDGRRLDGSFMVDTGFRSAVVLTRPFGEEHRLDGIEAQTGHGIGGPTYARVARAAALELGPVRLEEPVVEVSLARAGVLAESAFAGIVGGDVLRRFFTVFDYGAGRLGLDRIDSVDEPFEFDLAGLFLYANGADMSSVRVGSVVAGSPAAEAGVRAGDIVVSVDGAPRTREELRQLFRARPGARHRLVLSRDGDELTTELVLRRLV